MKKYYTNSGSDTFFFHSISLYVIFQSLLTYQSLADKRGAHGLGGTPATAQGTPRISMGPLQTIKTHESLNFTSGPT